MTNLTAEQISLTAVFVSWIAAYDIFEHEFNLMVHFPGGSTETFSEESSSFTFYSTVPGVHTITELYPEHYPVSETMVTVKGTIIRFWSAFRVLSPHPPIIIIDFTYMRYFASSVRCRII